MKFSNSFLKKSIGTNNMGQYQDNIGFNIRNNNIKTNNIEPNNMGQYQDNIGFNIRNNNIRTNNIGTNNMGQYQDNIGFNIRTNNIEPNNMGQYYNNPHFSYTNFYFEQSHKERHLRERHLRELREKELRERELREKELREKELRERELRERELREREIKEKELRERELREREIKEKELRERELREKELRERELREKELRERELREKELRERQSTECISKIEIYTLKLLQEKKITIENVYQEKYNNVNASGLGDFIRGSYFLMEFCDKNNISFNINILNHPISKFLEIYQNKQSLIINNINRFEEINFQPHISKNNIITNTYDSYTNNKFINYLRKQHVFNKKIYTYVISYPSKKIDEKHKEYMKQILQPCKQLELIVDNMLLELELIKKQFIIIHIRYGDEFLIKKKNNIEKSHLEMIQKILDKIDLSKKYLLISDNIIIKNILLSKYPFIKTHFNKISHTGEGVYHGSKETHLETIKLQNTMIDFSMFSHASCVIAFSIYKHGTGFSRWSTETYSVPYICRFLP